MSAQQLAVNLRSYRPLLLLLLAPIVLGPAASGVVTASAATAAAAAGVAQERLPDEEADLLPRERRVITDAAPRQARGAGLEEGPLPGTLTEQLKREASLRPAPAASELAVPASDTAGALGRARPGIVSRSEGLDRSTAGGSFPPDTSLAVGPESLLQAVNTAALLTTREGAELEAMSLFDFFGVAPTQLLSDPKVHFDPFSERYFMVLLEIGFDAEEAFFHLAMSKTAQPSSLAAGEWCNYRYSTVRQGAWGDYPGLGMNERWLAVSTNNFRFTGGFFESRLFVIDKSKVQGDLNSCPSFKLFAFNPGRDSTGEFVFNPEPAQHYDETGEPGSPLFAVSSQFGARGAAAAYPVWQIAGKGKRPKLSHQVVEAEGYSIPPNAVQPGNLELDSGDHRVMQQATYRNGQLWFAHTTACEVKGSKDILACVRVTGLRPLAEDGPAIDFQATLGKKKEYFFWPGVIVTEDGDVIVAALRSGTNRFLETSVFGMRAGAARFEELVSLPSPARAPRFGKARTTEPGDCTPINVSTTTDGRSIARSGDYVGLALDPVSEDFWVSGEHGKRGLVGCIWGTQIVRGRF